MRASERACLIMFKEMLKGKEGGRDRGREAETKPEMMGVMKKKKQKKMEKKIEIEGIFISVSFYDYLYHRLTCKSCLAASAPARVLKVTKPTGCKRDKKH